MKLLLEKKSGNYCIKRKIEVYKDIKVSKECMSLYVLFWKYAVQDREKIERKIIIDIGSTHRFNVIVYYLIS